MANILNMDKKALLNLDLKQVGRLDKEEILHILKQFEETKGGSFQDKEFRSNLWNSPKMVELFARQMVNSFFGLKYYNWGTHTVGISSSSTKLSQVFAEVTKLKLVKVAVEDNKIKQSAGLSHCSSLIFLEDCFTRESKLTEIIEIFLSVFKEIRFCPVLFTITKESGIEKIVHKGTTIYIRSLLDNF